MRLYLVHFFVFDHDNAKVKAFCDQFIDALIANGISLARPNFVAGITFGLSNWIFDGEISNMSNLRWMRMMDNSLIPVGGEDIENETLASEKININFGEVKILASNDIRTNF
jgi:hypothetical protein